MQDKLFAGFGNMWFDKRRNALYDKSIERQSGRNMRGERLAFGVYGFISPGLMLEEELFSYYEKEL